MSRFVLMAGGTGGHLFPAQALAQELTRRGHGVELMTDERIETYGADFPATKVHIVPSATPSLRNPIKLATAAVRIGWGMGVAFGKLRETNPDAVVGFGGYPTFPPMLTAAFMGIPTILHEANSVVGRANLALARFADVLAYTFEPTHKAEGLRIAQVQTGNPVRDAVLAAAAMPYVPPAPEGRIRLVVFGGSQGARAFADLVPPAIALLPEDMRRRLDIVQQCRPEDLDRVAGVYREAHVAVELAPFFADLPARMGAAHLVVCRSGATSIAELGALGRPAILVPLPGAIDGDQYHNAGLMDAAGGGWRIVQDTLSPQLLASKLQALFAAPDDLAAAARAAHGLGRPNAVAALADLCERAAMKTQEGEPQ